ncbi:ThuA domain-containing protein [Paludisphaera rhizosphaerae]|uniref:ThuA domain-containing protein n=1 Tax=Paludisphaera rhizosphaerae TaxID=2711216 RepID=UPI0013EA3A07|nr:ThuA domain-containing protein [Paludisphaera rhizosphaerae]
MTRFRLSGLAALILAASAATVAAAEPTKIVLLAGRPSHGPGQHEFNAGCKLLAKCLAGVPGVEPVVVAGGWPKDESVFDGAKALIFFMDGGGNHPAIQGDHLAKLQKLADKGVGLGFMHYAVEVPKGEPGAKFQDWIGGYYETGFSTNPHWKAAIESLPEHAITRGVQPFGVVDEWYYNIRFRPEMKGVTPILVAKPDDATRDTPRTSPAGPYKHIQEAKGRPEVLAWAVERPDGGRGFGFTGGHAHVNWGDPNFRKLALNAIVWTAGMDVPSEGVASSVSAEELKANLDPKGK